MVATPDRVTKEVAFEMSRVWSGRMTSPGALSSRKVTVERWRLSLVRGGTGRGGAGQTPGAGLQTPAPGARTTVPAVETSACAHEGGKGKPSRKGGVGVRGCFGRCSRCVRPGVLGWEAEGLVQLLTAGVMQAEKQKHRPFCCSVKGFVKMLRLVRASCVVGAVCKRDDGQ